MSAPAFTPGPWLHTEGSFPVIYLPDGGDLLDGGELGPTEATANARLIAAAPYLYEALQKARNTLAGCRMENIAADICDAALAKARGESA